MDEPNKYLLVDRNPFGGWVTYVDKNCNTKEVCASQRVSNGLSYEGSMQLPDTEANKKRTRMGGI